MRPEVAADDADLAEERGSSCVDPQNPRHPRPDSETPFLRSEMDGTPKVALEHLRL